jgi:protein SCO1/2
MIRPGRRFLPAALAALILLCGAAVRTRAQQSAETAPGPRAKDLDVAVVDQDGKSLNFYADLVKGRTVAVNFIFTTCTTICPPLGATFARVQKELGDRVGRDIFLVSISVDPVTDTPERLKAWGAKFKAGPGWTFVTGDKAQVERLLRALSADAASREDHTPMILVGNDRAGHWTRAYGLARPSKLAATIGEAAGKKP